MTTNKEIETPGWNGLKVFFGLVVLSLISPFFLWQYEHGLQMTIAISASTIAEGLLTVSYIALTPKR